MTALIGFCSLLGIFVCFILFVVALVRRKPKKKFVIGLAACFVLLIICAAITGSDQPDGSVDGMQYPIQQGESAEDGQIPDNGSEDANTMPGAEPSTALNTALDTSDYIKMDADVLFEYGGYMSGEKVVTVITVSSTGINQLKANTDNNDSLFYSINCEFEDREIVKQYDEGDVVTIAGTVGEKAAIGSAVTLKDCSVVGLGEIAQELKNGTEEQEQIGEQFKQAQEEQAAAEAAAERNEYISQCESVSYSDVERNPDNYDGMNIKISGTVAQVSEGWFDSVTLRVNCDGNMWYVTYTRSDGESRILEDDYITCYGECTGVTSYTSVLGSKVTIPSMKMVYYD